MQQLNWTPNPQRPGPLQNYHYHQQFHHQNRDQVSAWVTRNWAPIDHQKAQPPPDPDPEEIEKLISIAAAALEDELKQILSNEHLQLPDGVKELEFIGPPMEPTPEERAEQEVRAKIHCDWDERERQALEKQHTQPQHKHLHNQEYIHRRPYLHRARPHMSFYQAHSLMSTTYYPYPSAGQVLTVPMQLQNQQSRINQRQNIRNQAPAPTQEAHFNQYPYQKAYYNLCDEQECARMQADLEQVQPDQMVTYQDGPGSAVHYTRLTPRTWPYFCLPKSSVEWKPLRETEQIWNPTGPNRRGNDPSNMIPLPPPGFENVEPQGARDERGRPIPETEATTGKKSLSTRARKLLGEDVIVVPHTDYPTPQPMAEPERELKEALHFVDIPLKNRNRKRNGDRCGPYGKNLRYRYSYAKLKVDKAFF
ncbi:hypothetical protein KR074_009176 [Drosophila pseudoananassae]|nr:hypothetical protein KR074_009176 [Drosophila pseudoananassae]